MTRSKAGLLVCIWRDLKKGVDLVFWSLALEQLSTHWIYVLQVGADDLIPEVSYENIFMQEDQTPMKLN